MVPTSVNSHLPGQFLVSKVLCVAKSKHPLGEQLVYLGDVENGLVSELVFPSSSRFLNLSSLVSILSGRGRGRVRWNRGGRFRGEPWSTHCVTMVFAECHHPRFLLGSEDLVSHMPGSHPVYSSANLSRFLKNSHLFPRTLGNL